MKKLIVLFVVFCLTLCLAGCGKEAVSADTQNDSSTTESAVSPTADGATVDLTKLSSTMVYSEVYNMMVKPDDYIGKTVIMRGAFSVYADDNTGNRYFSCVIADATACCSQGLEFLLKGEPDYPSGYPEANTVITVKGTFNTYYEGEQRYCQLKDAEIVA